MGFNSLMTCYFRQKWEIEAYARYEELCLQVKKITGSEISGICTIPSTALLTVSQRISWLEIVKDYYLVFAELPKGIREAKARLWVYYNGSNYA